MCYMEIDVVEVESILLLLLLLLLGGGKERKKENPSMQYSIGHGESENKKKVD